MASAIFIEFAALPAVDQVGLVTAALGAIGLPSFLYWGLAAQPKLQTLRWRRDCAWRKLREIEAASRAAETAREEVREHLKLHSARYALESAELMRISGKRSAVLPCLTRAWLEQINHMLFLGGMSMAVMTSKGDAGRYEAGRRRYANVLDALKRANLLSKARP